MEPEHFMQPAMGHRARSSDRAHHSTILCFMPTKIVVVVVAAAVGFLLWRPCLRFKHILRRNRQETGTYAGAWEVKNGNISEDLSALHSGTGFGGEEVMIAIILPLPLEEQLRKQCGGCESRL